METLQNAHVRAVDLTVDAVRPITTDQLARRTPCADWNLAELLDHMTVQNHGFAAAAAGAGADEDLWRTGAAREDPVSDYLKSARVVTAAFAAPDVADRSFSLPELSRDQEFAGSQAMTMHMVDSFVHAWDVARAAGRGLDPDPELIDRTLSIAEQIPDDEARRRPGAPFGPPLAVPAGAPPLDRLLALFGRSPAWPNEDPRT
ncbi:TIGR03086 family metal-binding protein [Georgenia halophila]